MNENLAELKAYFETAEGSEIRIEESLRFLLHDPHSILYIQEGSVDIFALSLQGQLLFENKDQLDEMGLNTTPFIADLLEGPLTYIGSLAKGDLMFPFPFCSALDSLRIIAVAIYPVKLKKTSFRNFQNEIKDNPAFIQEVSNQVNQWIQFFDHLVKLGNKNGKKVYPVPVDLRATLSLTKGSLLSHTKVGTAKDKNTVIWVEPLQGELGVELPSSHQETYYLVKTGAPPFPLVHHLYLECLEESVIETLATEDLIKNNRFVWALLCYHQSALQWLTAALLLKKQNETEDLKTRTLHDDALLQNALKSASQILEASVPVSMGAAQNPLLSVCEWIGEREKLNFLKPNRSSLKDTWDEKVANICNYSGITYRKVYLERRWWEHTEGYILGFTTDQNPRAIQCHMDGKSAIIDPRKGTEKSLNADTAKGLQRFGYMFYRKFPEKDSLSMQDLLNFIFFRKSREIKIIIGCGFLAVLVSLFIPYATNIIFDQVIPTLDSTLLWQVGLAMIVSVASTALFQLAKECTINRMLSILDVDLMAAVWNRILSLKSVFFRKYEVGDLYLRVQGISDMAKQIAGAPLRILLNALFSILYLTSMFYYSPSLTVISLLVIVTMALITAVFISRNFAVQKEIMDIKGFTNSKVIEIIQAITKVRTSGLAPRLFSYWLQNFNKAKSLEKKQLSTQNMIASLIAFAPNLAYFLILASIIYTLSHQPSGTPSYITVGALMAFLAAYSPFSESVFEGLTTLVEMQTLKPLWDRAKPLLHEPLEFDSSKTKLSALQGAVRFEHVSFRYGPEAPLVLRDVNIEVKPGEFIGIVGLSGAGKSTIIRLIAGLETPESGEIFIDSHSLKNLDLQDFRRQISTVLQQGVILSGTLREFLSGGRSYPDEKLLWALGEAGFLEDLKDLPMGLGTVLINGAGTFSGGQKQRLILAKALVPNPKILLLDEATSALDNQTQELVKRNLDVQQITRIVVAHRLSTVRMADRIYVLDEGVIADQGTFEELSNKMGLFAVLLERQKG